MRLAINRTSRLGSLSVPAIIVILLALLIAGCSIRTQDTAGNGSPDGSLQQADVLRVVDGDTVIVRVDGREERLRYIGIDAPESVTPDQPVECFGPEAAGENSRLVAGRTVYLEQDQEERDRFGRLLGYVYVQESDGDLLMVNLLLVEQGFAEAGYYPPNVRYQDELETAEDLAREERLGLWEACD